jgi:hypothetical protein
VPPAPENDIEAILAAQDWGDLSSRLTRYVHVRLRKGSWETAEEIAQEAITQFLDPAYATWDRERNPDVFDALGSVANGLVQNDFRKRQRRGPHVSLRDDDRTHDDEEPELAQDDRAGDKPVLPPPADAVLLTDTRTAESFVTPSTARDESRKTLALARLRARLHGDAVCLGLLDRICAGEEGAAEDAKALGVGVTEVYNAKRRIHHHVRALAREYSSGGES